ncbi:dihydrodipicolinate synthase family protein [Ningiella sp. W23]|uniref:dihydrodipicolinate synthase family protein n=1 Tax=Ningiella sp. W23 TaxID=3023715 RepID=UPI003757D46A
MVFKGLIGFPITPIKESKVDLPILDKIREHLDQSGLDAIGVLGSTGSFAYLDENERERVMACWSKASTPWIAGVSATTTGEAIRQCKAANYHGAQGVIANAFSYVPLKENELQRYFLEIAEHSPLPLCVYDNPVNTGQTLSFTLLETLASHPNIRAIKAFAQSNNEALHSKLSALNWQAGYAVDANCCEAMIKGGKAWFSTLAGTMPELLVPIMNAIKQTEYDKARESHQALSQLFELMREHSGFRLMHALANHKGWQCELPSPLILPQIADLEKVLGS